MKNIFRILTLISLLAVFSCHDSRRGNAENEDSKEAADDANDDKFHDNNAQNDADFVSDVVANNYAEIKFSKVAEKRGVNSEVKEVAKLLADDQTKTLNELKTLAQTKAISVPVEETEKDKKTVENWNAESAKDLSKKWCNEMIGKHEDIIKKFEKRLDVTEDPELKAFIEKTLPHLRSDLDKLQACREKLNDRERG